MKLTPEDLLSQITSLFADNITGDISAEDARTVFTNLLDTALTSFATSYAQGSPISIGSDGDWLDWDRTLIRLSDTNVVIDTAPPLTFNFFMVYNDTESLLSWSGDATYRGPDSDAILLAPGEIALVVPTVIDGYDYEVYRVGLNRDNYWTTSDFSSGDIANWNEAHSWGDHSQAGYLTVETDPVFTASDVAGVTSSDIANWDEAYSWGDHADEDYDNRANHYGTQTASTISDFNTAADARITAQKGANNGIATLDSGGKVPVSQLPAAIMSYEGTWNASTNTPTLEDGTGDAGQVYIVSAAGTQDLGSGGIAYALGDWVVYNGSIWEKSINSNSVVSVNSQTGAVSLYTEDIPEGTNLWFTNQRAMDAVGNILVDTTTIDFDYDGTEIIADVVTGSIGNSHLRNSSALSIIGRASNSVGSPADIVASGDGDVLVRQGNTLLFDQVGTEGIVDGAVTLAKIENLTGLSVLGRSTNSSGGMGAITAANDGEVLRRNGTAIGFGTIATAGIADNAVSNAKIRDSSALSVIGRSANTSGDPADIAASSDGDVLRRSGTTLGFGTIATAGIANDAVTFAKMQNINQTRLIGRTTTGSGDPEEISIGSSLSLSAGSLNTAQALYAGAAPQFSYVNLYDSGGGSPYHINFGDTEGYPDGSSPIVLSPSLSSLQYCFAVYRDNSGVGYVPVYNLNLAECPRVDALINGEWKEVGRAIYKLNGLEKRGTHIIELPEPLTQFKLVEDEPEVSYLDRIIGVTASGKEYVVLEGFVTEPAESLGVGIKTEELFSFPEPVVKLITEGYYEYTKQIASVA